MCPCELQLPKRVRACDAHLRRVKAHPLGIVRHTLRQAVLRPPDIFLPLGIHRLGMRGSTRGLLCQSACDPVGVRGDKAVDLRLGRPVRRAHDHAPAAHLERQRAPAGANEFIRLHDLSPLCGVHRIIPRSLPALPMTAPESRLHCHWRLAHSFSAWPMRESSHSLQ